MAEQFGFVGVGRMGGPMARRLIDRGHRLTIFDLNEAAMAPLIARGAAKAPSVRALADQVETVFASLPYPRHRARGGARPGRPSRGQQRPSSISQPPARV